ncbi:hypothetical protein [Shewanella psychrotolerans]|uniref:hypothetical protein n=1 Tax=Shewanella psychrotolerans TaxID=2864206 RepID=UPI001C65FA0A|nr:hypothetical protein [Shewanella psychrotolerans]QYK02964.1 hypothetical protein K0I62_08580 [Shewanella psychrotolerans]
MNIYFLIAAIISLFTCIAHLTFGHKQFVKPMQQAQFEPAAKAAMHCVFHYVSVFLVLATMVLFACGLMLVPAMQSYSLVLFIALNFILFAIWQIYIGYFSDIAGAFRSLFQWFFFLLISGFILFGTFSR